MATQQYPRVLAKKENPDIVTALVGAHMLNFMPWRASVPNKSDRVGSWALVKQAVWARAM